MHISDLFSRSFNTLYLLYKGLEVPEPQNILSKNLSRDGGLPTATKFKPQTSDDKQPQTHGNCMYVSATSALNLFSLEQRNIPSVTLYFHAIR